jgi:hypothetical protein
MSRKFTSSRCEKKAYTSLLYGKKPGVSEAEQPFEWLAGFTDCPRGRFHQTPLGINCDVRFYFSNGRDQSMVIRYTELAGGLMRCVSV